MCYILTCGNIYYRYLDGCRVNYKSGWSKLDQAVISNYILKRRCIKTCKNKINMQLIILFYFLILCIFRFRKSDLLIFLISRWSKSSIEKLKKSMCGCVNSNYAMKLETDSHSIILWTDRPSCFFIIKK